MSEPHFNKDFELALGSESLSKNISFLMEENNISESELARSLNLPYNTIHRLLSGYTTDPRISTLMLIASYFNVSLDALFNEKKHTKNDLQMQKKVKAVPVVTWEQLSDPVFLNSCTSQSIIQWLPVSIVTTDEISKKAYAVESRPSMQPRFPIGTFFIVEPYYKPMDGDLVLVKIKQNNAVSLRELVLDPPSIQLLPIIENSEVINYKEADHELIGVIVLSMHHFRRN